MRNFRLIANLIAMNGEDDAWVVRGQGLDSQKIEKHILIFMSKAWWTLDRHRLFPTTGIMYSTRFAQL